MKKNPLIAGCPIDTAINILKGKCKAAIVLEVHKGNNKFGLLAKTVAISEKLLSVQLAELIEDGVIIKEKTLEPLKSDYRLTSWGEKLIPIIKEMFHWEKPTIKWISKKSIFPQSKDLSEQGGNYV